MSKKSRIRNEIKRTIRKIREECSHTWLKDYESRWGTRYICVRCGAYRVTSKWDLEGRIVI